MTLNGYVYSSSGVCSIHLLLPGEQNCEYNESTSQGTCDGEKHIPETAVEQIINYAMD